MANNDNLKMFTKETARENGRKGGIATGKAKRKRKEIRECLEELLNMEIESKKGESKLGSEALAAVYFKKALSGDLQSAIFVRDTAGQKPVDKMEMTEAEIKINFGDEYEEDRN